MSAEDDRTIGEKAEDAYTRHFGVWWRSRHGDAPVPDELAFRLRESARALRMTVDPTEKGPAPIRLDPGLPVVALRWIESVVAEFPGEDEIPLLIGDRSLTLGAQDCPQLRDAVSEVVKRAERWRDDRI